MMSRNVIEDMSARFTRAITGPRLELLDDLLAEDFVMWYNFTNSLRTRDEVLPFFHAYFPTVNVSFDDIRLTATESGWIQQHRVNADGADGFKIRDLFTCLVVTVAGGRIARIDEYVDSAQAGGFDTSRIDRGE